MEVFWLPCSPAARPPQPSPWPKNIPADQLVKTKPRSTPGKATISDYIIKIARLGGFSTGHLILAGEHVIGMTKLNDIHLGFLWQQNLCIEGRERIRALLRQGLLERDGKDFHSDITSSRT